MLILVEACDSSVTRKPRHACYRAILVDIAVVLAARYLPPCRYSAGIYWISDLWVSTPLPRGGLPVTTSACGSELSESSEQGPDSVKVKVTYSHSSQFRGVSSSQEDYYSQGGAWDSEHVLFLSHTHTTVEL